ncbi:heparinase II/III family protein [Ketogulonicigenium robustum]|uniref:heparinase II/III family protein n=1 Tax=Ketogulonicigenium robustum TaxID=92947 RepID=UPI000A271866|nr:heparinase II/III family protein [Ketogulonicigenium robustum]
MTATPAWTARQDILNRFYARRAGGSRIAPSFARPPEPFVMGEAERGRHLMAGRFVLDGRLVDVLGAAIWDNAMYAAPLQRFDWLGDLAALGDDAARRRAQGWVWEWIDRYGKGAGWTPQTAAARLVNMLHHAAFALQGMSDAAQRGYMQALGRQARYLSRSWALLPEGVERIYVLAALNMAASDLVGMDRLRAKAEALLLRDLTGKISPEGEVQGRNPDDQAGLFIQLVLVATHRRAGGAAVPSKLQVAIASMAPVLRGLRHADGSLVRMQGSNGGHPAALDAALSLSEVKTPAGTRLHMGFARINAGRMVVIADAAAAPASGHASATAIEVSVGRRPLLTSCGDGAPFGRDWLQAGRATASHSTMVIDAGSRPADVMFARTALDGGTRLELGHDGWRAAHGLVYARQIDVDLAGRAVVAEEMLMTISPEDQTRFDRAMVLTGGRGVDFALRFHLHPDVSVLPQDDATQVNFVLKNGEVWTFSHDGQARLTVEPSVFMENGAASPRNTHQVVLSGRVMSYATRMRWALGRATG